MFSLLRRKRLRFTKSGFCSTSKSDSAQRRNRCHLLIHPAGEYGFSSAESASPPWLYPYASSSNQFIFTKTFSEHSTPGNFSLISSSKSFSAPLRRFKGEEEKDLVQPVPSSLPSRSTTPLATEADAPPAPTPVAPAKPMFRDTGSSSSGVTAK